MPVEPPLVSRYAAILAVSLVILPLPRAVVAGEVSVVDATVDCQGERCRATVTLRHADSGWDHYADAFVVLDPDGTELGRRVLLHPHVQEQPFTRSLDSLTIPPGIERVRVLGHDKVHGDGAAIDVTVNRR